MTQPPAGWYPDYAEPLMERYWDGSEWTSAVRSATPVGEPKVTTSQKSPFSPDPQRTLNDVATKQVKHPVLISLGVLVVLGVLIGGCASLLASDSEEDSGPLVTKWDKQQAREKARIDKDNYEMARYLCDSPSAEIARDFGLPPTAEFFEIAEAYAEDYQPAYRQPNFDGCADGLRAYWMRHQN